MFITAFAFAFVTIVLLKPIAAKLHLVDKPGGRKKHEGHIPLVGGVAVYLSVTLSVILLLEQPIFIRLFLLAGGLMVFLGLLDDRYNISARTRLLGQLIICSLFAYGLDIQITSFGNLFGFGELEAGIFSYPLTILSLMGAINAFNMLDGMDGLVGSIVIVSFLGLLMLFGVNGNLNYQLLCVAFIAAISAFLVFNLWGSKDRKHINKIFMGDAGSMFLGLSLGVLLIKGSQQDVAAFSPITSLWLVLLPMTDMFTIMYRRMKRGRSPMAADRTHIHHILLRAGFNRLTTLQIMILAQVVFVSLGAVMYYHGFSDGVSFAVALGFILLYQLLMKRSWRLIRWTRKKLI